jgi:hypothetical protein
MKRWIAVGLLVLTALVSGGAAAAAPRVGSEVAAAPGVAAAPYCGITWGSLPKAGGALAPAYLLEARTGRHDCYDRVVFEFEGPATGFNIGYREVYTEAAGVLMNPYVVGGAVLGVQLMSPAYNDDYSIVYPARPGQHVANVLGYDTLRDVMYGGSFEGYATFAVGVRANLPFRVSVLAGPGTHSRIALDTAHHW